jgi:Holliday junction resolvase RusA-like endonuclease
MDNLTLRYLPCSVSVNSAYSNIGFSRGIIRNSSKRCKSKKYLEFEQKFNAWALTHSKDIREAREWIKGKGLFSLHITMCFPMSMLFTKKGEVKKFDCSNYIKSCEDKITELLGFDDSRIFKCSIEKKPNPENLIGSWMNVEISEYKITLT